MKNRTINGTALLVCLLLILSPLVSAFNFENTFTIQKENYEARYYDPVLKKFTQPDTLIQDVYDPQSLNRYSYVRNNPYKYVDPTGNFFSIVAPVARVAAHYATQAFSYVSNLVSTVAGEVLTYVEAYFINEDIQSFQDNPNALNTIVLASDAVGMGSVPGKGRVVGRVVKQGVKYVDEAGRVIGDVNDLNRKIKELRTAESGKTVTVNSFEKAELLLHKAFPGYKKLAGNSPIPKSEMRRRGLRTAEKKFEELKQGWYKMDYQYISTDKIHESGAHSHLPNINIYTSDGRKVSILIDKTKR